MNQLAVAIVIILFPGIIAAIISDKITVHSTKWNSFKYAMYSFVLGVSCYVLLQITYNAYEFMAFVVKNISALEYGQLQVWSIIVDQDAKINLSEVFKATALAVPISFFATFLVNHKIFNKLAKFIKVSGKYGDENLFSYYLSSEEVNWVYIRDIENNLTYQGIVDSYSENDNIQEIVLYEVTVYPLEEEEELYSLPSIYLCKKMGKFIIESIPKEYLEESDD